MAIPRIYTKTTAPVASYSYTEIASGTGIKLFYGMATYEGGANSYILSENEEYSDLVVVNIGSATSIDFDLTQFNIPKRMDGTAYISWAAELQTAGAGTVVQFQLKKWDGTSETNLTAQVSTKAVTAGGTISIATLPLTTLANFAEGDVLRLNVECSTAAGGINLGIDPKERSDTNLTTKTSLKVYVPFKLDI